MKLKNLKTGYIVLIFLLLLTGLAGTVHAGNGDPPTLTPASGALPAATQGQPYTTAVIASNAKTPYTWNPLSGTNPAGLPPGLNWTTGGTNNATGTISGTPTSSGTFTFTVQCRSGNNKGPTTGNYTITVNPSGCSFNGTNTGSILFGNIDPMDANPVVGTVTSPQFTCSAGMSYTVTVNPASGWQLSSGSNTIGHTLGVTPSGTYAGTAVAVFTAGGSTLSQSQYGNAPAGVYLNASATTVTISFSGGSLTASLPVGSVTGTVLNTCKVTASPALNFGTLDGVTNAGGATAAVTPPSMMCTMGTPVMVTSNGGLNFSGTPRLKDSSTNYINYNVSFTSSLSGAGASTDIGGSGAGHLAMGGTIPPGALDNAPAGMYSDTLTLTISY